MKENPEDHFLIELNQNIRIVHRICHIYFRDRDEREDMFQEIMYQLWKSYSTFKGESKFSTWMYIYHTVHYLADYVYDAIYYENKKKRFKDPLDQLESILRDMKQSMDD